MKDEQNKKTDKINNKKNNINVGVNNKEAKEKDKKNDKSNNKNNDVKNNEEIKKDNKVKNSSDKNYKENVKNENNKKIIDSKQNEEKDKSIKSKQKDDNNQKLDNEKKDNKGTKDNLKEKNNEVGKKEFISTINKKIKSDYESLHNLEMEIHRINQELDNAKSVSDFDKLIDRAKKNNKEINDIISRINMIKDGSIIDVVYNLSKKQPKELKDYIDTLKKESNNSKYLSDLYPIFKEKLDYTDRVNNIGKNTNILINNIEKKETLNEKLDNKINDNEKDMTVFNNKLLKFRDKLLTLQMSINNYSMKVNNIVPKKIVENKYYLNDMEIKNNKQLQSIAVKLAKNPSDINEIQNIYDKLRSQLRVVTKTSIVPSSNYKFDLLKEKTNLSLTKKEILSTLMEVRSFKEEFSEQFNDHLSSSEFYKYYSEIESMENKLINEEERANILDSKINQTIIENDKKVNQIEKINLQNKKKKDEEEKNKKKDNVKNEDNKKKNKNNESNLNAQNYFEYMNNFANYSNEYEEEKTRGRSR